MKLHHKFRPITFFLAGLLLGLGYLGASYVMHLTVLQKVGDKLTQTVQKYQNLKKKYETDQGRIQEFMTWVESKEGRLKEMQTLYEKYYKSFQPVISDLVNRGKSHNLTFLDYQSSPSTEMPNIPGARLFTSHLSFGGTFKNIQNFLVTLQTKSSFHLPLFSIEILSSSERNVQLKMTFTYVGELDEILRNVTDSTVTSHSLFIVDPWRAVDI